MRIPRVVLGLLVLLTACGDDGGAILLLSAPDGPANAHRLEIVLASAADDLVAHDIDQRVDGTMTEAPVTYYRQRATGGSAMAVAALDGFTIQIEPERTIATDDQFIPFLLVRDELDQVIAVGTVDDAEGTPFAVDVTRSDRVEYVTTVRPVSNSIARGGLHATGRAVFCGSDASGIVWTPDRGPQLRLVFPEAGQTDASTRPLDLDCDLGEADADEPDCDDLDELTHRGAVETCDGIDTNCDGVEPRVQVCDFPTGVPCNGPPSSADGILICDTDDGDLRSSVCSPGPTCSGPGSSRRCFLGFELVSSNNFTTCSPGEGMLQLCGGNICRVRVESVDPGLEVEISANRLGNYGTEATGVKTYIHVKDLVSSHSMGTPPHFGSVVLSIDNAAAGTILTVLLQIDLEDTQGCIDAQNGNFEMSCTQ